MNPCTEMISMFWTDFLRKMNPAKQNAIHASESMLLATQKIQKSVHELEKKQNNIEEQIKTQAEQIRAHAKRGDKRAATTCLLKRRRLIAQQAKVFNTICALESQIDTIDATETNTALLAAFKSSSTAFKKWKENNPVKNAEDVEVVKQDLEDQIQNSNEILDAISQPINIPGEDVAMENIEIDEILQEIDDVTEVQSVNNMQDKTKIPKTPRVSPRETENETVEVEEEEAMLQN